MILINNIDVHGFKTAFRGLRNPYNSWDKADSFGDGSAFHIGKKDMELAQRMLRAGTDESKFMRQIYVGMDITAPLYWWKEASTYKVATVANSTSTMHRITAKPIELTDFSFDNLDLPVHTGSTPHGGDYEIVFADCIDDIIYSCERLRQLYLETKDQRYWRALIQLLPDSYNQKRTWTANYAVLRNIYFARRNHKLQEWRDFCSVIEEALPYAQDLICYEEKKE